MLDQMTGGRLIVFLLRGTPNELGVYNNIDPAQSKAITQEASLLIRKALSAAPAELVPGVLPHTPALRRHALRVLRRAVRSAVSGHNTRRPPLTRTLTTSLR